MSRRVGEPVTVRVAGEGTSAGVAGPPEGEPASFLWHDRLYVVREVLGHWRERRAWWTTGAARAVHGEDRVPPSAAGGGAAWDAPWTAEDTRPGGRGEGGVRHGDEVSAGAGSGTGEACADGAEVRLLAPGTRVPLEGEREVWRVEASPGRVFGTGVYDLCRSGAAPPTDAWRLLRVSD